VLDWSSIQKLVQVLLKQELLLRDAQLEQALQQDKKERFK